MSAIKKAATDGNDAVPNKRCKKDPQSNWHILFCHTDLELWEQAPGHDLAQPDVRKSSQMDAVKKAVRTLDPPPGADDELKRDIKHINEMVLFCVLGYCLFGLDLRGLWHSHLNFHDDIHVLCLKQLVYGIKRENYAKILEFRNGNTKYDEDFQKGMDFMVNLLDSIEAF